MNSSKSLEQAAFQGDIVELARLLDAGANIDQGGQNWNPLHAAIENENIACVKLLLSRGADVEYRSTNGLSPLAHAVDISIDGTIQSGGRPGDEPTDIIALLIAAGADTAPGLEVAQTYQSEKIIQLLLNAKKIR